MQNLMKFLTSIQMGQTLEVNSVYLWYFKKYLPTIAQSGEKLIRNTRINFFFKTLLNFNT